MIQKTNILISGYLVDVEYFKKQQLIYREQGKMGAEIFRDMIDAYREKLNDNFHLDNLPEL